MWYYNSTKGKGEYTMVRMYNNGINSQFYDSLNKRHERNLNNTPRRSFNCGGFALGIYSWYCPREGESEREDYMFKNDEQANNTTLRSVECMLKDFPTLRVVKSLEEVQSDEYAILFRHSSDGDFHYLRRGRNGVWYHKRGKTRTIDTMPKAKIFEKWCWRYDGPIVIFAKKRDE